MPQAPADRVVLITGANEGIGYHMAESLLADGYRVACFDIDGDGFASLREAYPGAARFHRCDVTEDEDVERAVDAVIEEWGTIHVLVNNAAVFRFGFFEDRSPEDTRREFEVNYFGYLRTIRAVLPHMLANDEGIIHNVSSGVGLVGNPGLSGYASTKGAIEAFTRSLRLELRRENVTPTLMHPRLAKTRSAATLGFPDSQLADPAYVGRKLADRIESTRRVVYTDWTTRLGLALVRWVPGLLERGTERFLDERPSP